MKLKLERPICFYDLETTSLDIITSKIVTISVLKLFPDGTTDGKSIILNPTIPIPKEASDVHGITDLDVKSAPTFKY
jgi:DNA polymerase-3 subunit epsilon